MEKFLKDNILYLLIAVMAVVGGIYAVVYFGMQGYNTSADLKAKNDELQTKQERLDQIKRAKMQAQTQEKRKVDENAKIIYEVLGAQFTPEASFGIMFEDILSNITNSGIRIRKIEYNYQPTDDKILNTNAEGYNACELSFIAVGNYMQFQDFFKNIAKEKYLTGINEIYLEPYDKDKSILIARFKIRLYTKTI